MIDQAYLFVAQIPDPIWNALMQAGILAPVLGWFMWRDGKRDEKMAQVINAINQLTRGLALEVLSRPNAIERAKTEANDILAQVGERKP